MAHSDSTTLSRNSISSVTRRGLLVGSVNAVLAASAPTKAEAGHSPVVASALRLMAEPGYSTLQIRMNTQHGPLTDPNLRKAICYAMDYEAMLDVTGHPILPQGLSRFDTGLEACRTNLEQAKAHLARSHWPDGGVTLTVIYVTGHECDLRCSLVLLDSLAKLDIKLDIRQMRGPDLNRLTASPLTTPDFLPVYEVANDARPNRLA